MPKVFLEDRVEGFCDLVVPKNRRQYLLRPSRNDCGLVTWSGNETRNGINWQFQFNDARTAQCGDEDKSKFTTVETSDAGSMIKLYGELASVARSSATTSLSEQCKQLARESRTQCCMAMTESCRACSDRTKAVQQEFQLKCR